MDSFSHPAHQVVKHAIMTVTTDVNALIKTVKLDIVSMLPVLRVHLSYQLDVMTTYKFKASLLLTYLCYSQLPYPMSPAMGFI